MLREPEFIRLGRSPRPAAGIVAVIFAFAALSLGSTIAKSSGSSGSVVAFWRFLIGAALWHALVAVRRAGPDRRRHVSAAAWRAAAVPGIAFGVNLSLFFSGVARTPIAHAEFISASTPLVLVPLAASTLNERVPRHVVTWGGIALGGIALIVTRSTAGGTSYTGDLLVVGAVAAWIGYLMSAKAARSRLGTTEFMAVVSSTACLTTLPIAVVAGGSGGLLDLPAKGWILVAVLAVSAGGIAHGLIAWAQRRVPLGTISLLQLSQPGLGVLWAASFLGEPVKPVQIVGMVVVLAAVGTIARTSAHGFTPRPPLAPAGRRRAAGDGGKGRAPTTRPDQAPAPTDLAAIIPSSLPGRAPRGPSPGC